jgi:hypothetical protein
MSSSEQLGNRAPLKGLISSTQAGWTKMSIPSDTTKLNVCICSDDNDISNGSGSTISGDQPLLKDPKEHKRQRERDPYKQLCDKKGWITKKHRETRQQKEVIPLTSEQIEARRASARSHYTNLKPEPRQTICDRQRLLYANMTAEKKMQREIVKSTLCDTTKYSK